MKLLTYSKYSLLSFLDPVWMYQIKNRKLPTLQKQRKKSPSIMHCLEIIKSSFAYATLGYVARTLSRHNQSTLLDSEQ